jgi:hypothetical protein
VFGVVYKRRKSFEESLGMINKMITNHLDEAEVSAQEMFPHYFEKYKTDGVEFTLYLGTSLVKGKTFDSFYLKNLSPLAAHDNGGDPSQDGSIENQSLKITWTSPS